MGSWAVDITRSGSYSFILSKLHPAAPKTWNTLSAGKAHILCGGFKIDKEIIKGADSVTLQARLDKGAAQLECWFEGQRRDGGLSGAYFVEVEKM